MITYVTHGEDERADRIELLIGACNWLLLEPDSEDARDALAHLTARDLSLLDGDSLFVASLVKEANAHADELAFRLEEPGYTSVYIGATTARLCQTLALLKLQMARAAPAGDLLGPAGETAPHLGLT